MYRGYSLSLAWKHISLDNCLFDKLFISVKGSPEANLTHSHRFVDSEVTSCFMSKMIEQVTHQTITQIFFCMINATYSSLIMNE